MFSIENLWLFEEKVKSGEYGNHNLHLLPREKVEKFLRQDNFSSTLLRWNYISAYGFCIYTQELRDFLLGFHPEVPFVDLMCGTGYLSEPLVEAGREVYAVDLAKNDFKIEDYRPFVLQGTWQKFFTKNIPLLQEQKPTILVSWPGMTEDMADICQALRDIKFSGTLFYIGEWEGGCNADDRFFIENRLTSENDFRLPSCKWGDGPIGFDCPTALTTRFFGLHDYLHEVNIWKRGEEDEDE